jgi:hypothetical protein
MSATEALHTLDENEAQKALLREQRRALPRLLGVLEAVSGHRDGEAPATDSDEEHASEQQMFAKARVLMANMRHLHYTRTRLREGTSYRDRLYFGYYDSLHQSLVIRKNILKHFCRQRRERDDAGPESPWLQFFWGKWDGLIDQLASYRDHPHVPRHHMRVALFEWLVCLFLTGEQIDLLRKLVQNDVDTDGALQMISDMNEFDVRGDRQYLLSELDAGDVPGPYNTQLLKTAVYMVQVDMVGDPACIAYGDCLDLLTFAKTETVRLDSEIDALDEGWQTFLGTLQDADGNALKPCSICETNIRDVVFMPCGHVGTCRACADEWKMRSDTCPYCRARIQSIDSVSQHLNAETRKLHSEIVCDGRNVSLRQQAHVTGGDVLSLLTQLRHVA